ncbi:MAG TPA: glycosyltransferase family 2 protein [Cyanobacteria bacterium UBA11371]|nr:glycosyltransferase family 2 protein [Cyanobacteria bacterium UBA11371]
MASNIPEIRLSVALVTRNRPESLKRCLESWRSQTVSPFEIVVSDDSDPTYASQIRELAQQFGCLYTPGPRRGLYANRNHASLICSGTHILSADDDHTHPQDYVEKILEVVASDAKRVWIFTERNPSYPDTSLICPPELHRSGGGCMPKDPSNCAAIADGSSVYPRQIFDQGLRYDETYPFGNMFYLWGQVLVKEGWRISFSDATFVWHNVANGGREFDQNWLKHQIECNMYVLFVHAWWVNPSIINTVWAFIYLLKQMLFKVSVIGYEVKVRLGINDGLRLLIQAWSSRHQYYA